MICKNESEIDSFFNSVDVQMMMINANFDPKNVLKPITYFGDTKN